MFHNPFTLSIMQSSLILYFNNNMLNHEGECLILDLLSKETFKREACFCIQSCAPHVTPYEMSHTKCPLAMLYTALDTKSFDVESLNPKYKCTV